MSTAHSLRIVSPPISATLEGRNQVLGEETTYLVVLHRRLIIIVTFSFSIILMWNYMLIWSPSVPTVSAPINWQKICSTLSQNRQMTFGYYGRTSLLLSAAAECPLLRVQGDITPRHLLLKPMNTDPTGVHQLLAQRILSRTQPVLLTQEEYTCHQLIIWYIGLGSVPAVSTRLSRRRGTNRVTSALFPFQWCILAGRLWSESGTPNSLPVLS